jgi:hypothetical protein
MFDSWPCNEGAVVRMLDRHRFPPPWSVEETPACFIVRDRAGQALAHLLTVQVVKVHVKKLPTQ